MEKRTVLAFVLSFLVLLVWAYFFTPKEQPQQPKQATQTETPKEAPRVPENPAAVPPSPVSPPVPSERLLPPMEEKEITVDTPLYRAVLSNVGPTFKSFQLKKYHQTAKPESPLVDMIHLPKDQGEFLNINFATTTPSATPSRRSVYQVNKEGITLGPGSSPEDLVFQSVSPGGILTTQTYRFYPDRYGMDLTVDALNRTTEPVTGSFTSEIRAMSPSGKGSYYSYIGLAVFHENTVEELKLEKVGEEKAVSGQIGWMSYEDDYFISAVVPEQNKGTFTGRHLPTGVLEGTYRPASLSLNPSERVSSEFDIYLGPRELGTLKAFGHDLDRSVNFGWTNIIAKPLLYLLKVFDRFTHNYGIAIILLTVVVKIIFWPLTHKSYKSMKEMQKLQPRMAKIREKYKGNKEQMNKEMMSLYKTYKVNPLSGCLPMIIQIPVFFALFRILGSAIELRHAPFLLWINDLSAPDRLGHFSFQIPFMSPPYGIPVLTLLMGVSMFIQQKMTPTVGDPAQAKMMMFLPVIFTFMFINFPAGLVLYWLVNNLLSIAQQYRIQKRST